MKRLKFRQPKPGEKTLANLFKSSQNTPSDANRRAYMKKALSLGLVANADGLVTSLTLTAKNKILDELKIPKPGSQKFLEQNSPILKHFLEQQKTPEGRLQNLRQALRSGKTIINLGNNNFYLSPLSQSRRDAFERVLNKSKTLQE